MTPEKYVVRRCLDLEREIAYLKTSNLVNEKNSKMLQDELDQTRKDLRDMSELLLKLSRNTIVAETTTEITKEKGLLISHSSAVWQSQNPEFYDEVMALAEKYGILKKKEEKGGEK